MELSTDCISIIFGFSDFRSKLNILALSTHHRQYEGFVIDIIPEDLCKLLTDKVLQQDLYRNLKTLYVHCSITNNSLSKLTKLHTVYIIDKVSSDVFVDNKSLHLVIDNMYFFVVNKKSEYIVIKDRNDYENVVYRDNCKDCQEKRPNIKFMNKVEGMKHMLLHTLNTSYNEKITDEGIKHMHLHTLYASYNSKITDEGIKHIRQLHTLDISSFNSKITDEGIKRI